MSLLMEALRKAEQQKRQQGGPDPVMDQPPGQTTGGLTLEPVILTEQTEAATPTKLELALETPQKPARPPLTKPSAKSSDNQLPELPSRLEDLDDQFMVHATKPAPKPRPVEPPPVAEPPTPEPASPGDAEAARESARNLFAAKPAPRNDRRSFAIAMGMLAVAGAAGIGGWFWWQLQPKGGIVASGGAPQTIAMAPAPVIAPPPAPAQGAVPPAPTFPEPSPTPVTPTTRAAITDQEADDEETAAPPRPAPAKRVREVAPPPVPESPIRLGKATLKTSPLLEEAYQAFQRGETELARAAWQKALATDPLNANALHGLAAIALRDQRPDLAADYYLRALQADPRDALALAGLVSLKPPGDPQLMESRLKILLAEQPDSPYLNFALGNLHARAARWAEAQQAFFRAHVADPGHPDYLFNLAVSLDQLHQNRLAVEHYQRALAAAANQPAGFDAAQVAARLKALQAGE